MTPEETIIGVILCQKSIDEVIMLLTLSVPYQMLHLKIFPAIDPISCQREKCFTFVCSIDVHLLLKARLGGHSLQYEVR